MDDLKNIPRIIRTIVINLEFLALGVLQATPGPTLLDLQARVDTSSHKIALILVACLAGGLVGSMMDMFLNKKMNRELLMVIYAFLIGIAHFVCPWWTHLTPLIISMTLSGLFNGALNGGSNIFILNLWGKRSHPFLQGLHSSFALGAFIAPLMTEPFLQEEEDDVGTEDTLHPYLNATITKQVPYQIYYPFAFGSIIMWTSGIGFLIMYIIRRQNFSKVSNPEEENGEKNFKPTFSFKTIAVILSMGLSALASALDLTTGTYLTTFAVKCSMKLSKSTGSLITSAYWGSFTIGRLISIPLASKMTALNMLLLNVFLCNLSGIILGVWSDDQEWALWTGSAIMGLGVSSMSPNVLMWTKHCGSASAVGTSLFVVSAFTGALILPLIIGFFVDTLPMIFMYSLLACTVISAVAMIACYFMSHIYEKNKSKLENSSSSTDMKAVTEFNGGVTNQNGGVINQNGGVTNQNGGVDSEMDKTITKVD